MKTDCQWFDTNMEAYFSDALSESDVRRSREHLEGCAICSQQVQKLQAIDPLVRQVFRYRMEQASRSVGFSPQPRIARLAVVGMSVAGAIALGLALWPNPPDAAPIPVVVEQPAPPQDLPVPEAPGKKSTQNPTIERAKADDVPASVLARPIPGTDAPVAGGPDFAVIDAAGYSTNLETYRGLVLIVGIWSANQPETAESLNRIHQAFGNKPQVRILGVAAHRQDKVDGTTFPVVFNYGSRLLGLKAGEFLLLDKAGNKKLSGSLVTGTNTLLTRIKTQLDQSGVQ